MLSLCKSDTVKPAVINPEVILEHPYKDADTEFKIRFVILNNKGLTNKQTHRA